MKQKQGGKAEVEIELNRPRKEGGSEFGEMAEAPKSLWKVVQKPRRQRWNKGSQARAQGGSRFAVLQEEDGNVENTVRVPLGDISNGNNGYMGGDFRKGGGFQRGDGQQRRLGKEVAKKVEVLLNGGKEVGDGTSRVEEVSKGHVRMENSGWNVGETCERRRLPNTLMKNSGMVAGRKVWLISMGGSGECGAEYGR